LRIKKKKEKYSADLPTLCLATNQAGNEPPCKSMSAEDALIEALRTAETAAADAAGTLEEVASGYAVEEPELAHSKTEAETLRRWLRSNGDVSAPSAKAHGMEGFDTRLHHAARRNEHGRLARLLEEDGADADALDELGATALWYASAAPSKPQCVRALLRAKANVHHCSEAGDTALTVASRAHLLDVMSILIEEGGAEVDFCGFANYSPLQAAVTGPPGGGGREGASLHARAVQLLLDARADPNAVGDDACYADPPLFTAASCGRPDVMRALIEAGAELRPNDEQQREQAERHISRARHRAHADVVEVLKQAVRHAAQSRLDVEAELGRRRRERELAAALRAVGECPCGQPWRRVLGGWRCRAGGHRIDNSRLSQLIDCVEEIQDRMARFGKFDT
jgi:hypothetical protein